MDVPDFKVVPGDKIRDLDVLLDLDGLEGRINLLYDGPAGSTILGIDVVYVDTDEHGYRKERFIVSKSVTVHQGELRILRVPDEAPPEYF
ncbi:MAG: hypothetical protein QM658_03420 [Gordonia sp. (in: high G+C Gram-positive bacteria)]